ncbi:hypothetical protein [Streptomyces atratus]|uniref:hypothetical protein n=1 Tax=Streptomyces atratus TaxID=1893 RepID=UPI00224FFB68|nr:hypothetical protein [Streptomyces atratus]MCX5338642.1 hypothetical protein [Streptomyces atratus]
MPVLAFITELAVHDPHDDVRLHSLLALEWLPTAASVSERLRSIPETDRNPLVRDTAQAFLDDDATARTKASSTAWHGAA